MLHNQTIGPSYAQDNRYIPAVAAQPAKLNMETAGICRESETIPLDLSVKRNETFTSQSVTGNNEYDEKYSNGPRTAFANPWSKDWTVWNAKKSPSIRIEDRTMSRERTNVDKLAADCAKHNGEIGIDTRQLCAYNVTEHYASTQIGKLNDHVGDNRNDTLLYKPSQPQPSSLPVGKIHSPPQTFRLENNTTPPSAHIPKTTNRVSPQLDSQSPELTTQDDTNQQWHQFKVTTNPNDTAPSNARKRKHKAKTWQVPVGHDERPIPASVALMTSDSEIETDTNSKIQHTINANTYDAHIDGEDYRVDRPQKSDLDIVNYVMDDATRSISASKAPLFVSDRRPERNQGRQITCPAGEQRPHHQSQHDDVLRALLTEQVGTTHGSQRPVYHHSQPETRPLNAQQLDVMKQQRNLELQHCPRIKMEPNTSFAAQQLRNVNAPGSPYPNFRRPYLEQDHEHQQKQQQISQQQQQQQQLLLQQHDGRNKMQTAPVQMTPKTLRLTPTPKPRASYQITTISPDEVSNYKNILQRDDATLIPVYLDEMQEKTSMLVSRDGPCTELRAVVIGRAPSTEADIKEVPHDGMIMDSLGAAIPSVPVKQSGVTSSIQTIVRPTMATSIHKHKGNGQRGRNVKPCLTEKQTVPLIMPPAVSDANNRAFQGQRPLIQGPQLQRNNKPDPQRQSFPNNGDELRKYNQMQHLRFQSPHAVGNYPTKLGPTKGKNDTLNHGSMEVGHASNRRDLKPVAKTRVSENVYVNGGVKSEHVNHSARSSLASFPSNAMERHNSFHDTLYGSDISRNILEQLNNLSVSKLLEIQRSWTNKPECHSDTHRKHISRTPVNNERKHELPPQPSHTTTCNISTPIDHPIPFFANMPPNQFQLLRNSSVLGVDDVRIKTESTNDKYIPPPAPNIPDRKEVRLTSNSPRLSVGNEQREKVKHCVDIPDKSVVNQRVPTQNFHETNSDVCDSGDQHRDNGVNKAKVNPALRDALDARLSSVISANDSLLQAHEVPRKRPWSKKDWESGDDSDEPSVKSALISPREETKVQLPPPVFRSTSHEEMGQLTNRAERRNPGEVTNEFHDKVGTQSITKQKTESNLLQNSVTSGQTQGKSCPPSSVPTQTTKQSTQCNTSAKDYYYLPKKNKFWRQSTYSDPTSTPATSTTDKTREQKAALLSGTAEATKTELDPSKSPFPVVEKKTNVTLTTSDKGQSFTDWLKEQLLTNEGPTKHDASKEVSQEKVETQSTISPIRKEEISPKRTNVANEENNNMAGMIQTMIEVIMENQRKKVDSNEDSDRNNNNNSKDERQQQHSVNVLRT